MELLLLLLLQGVCGVDPMLSGRGTGMHAAGVSILFEEGVVAAAAPPACCSTCPLLELSLGAGWKALPAAALAAGGGGRGWHMSRRSGQLPTARRSRLVAPWARCCCCQGRRRSVTAWWLGPVRCAVSAAW